MFCTLLSRTQKPTPSLSSGFNSGPCFDGLLQVCSHGKDFEKSWFLGWGQTLLFTLPLTKVSPCLVTTFKTNIWIWYHFAFSQIRTFFRNWLQKLFCPSFPIIFKSNYTPRIMKAMCSHFAPRISSTGCSGRSPGRRLRNPCPGRRRLCLNLSLATVKLLVWKVKHSLKSLLL